MKNLNKAISIFTLSFIFLSFDCAKADDLLIFDNPNLIAIRSKGNLYGYYGVEDRDTSCVFFFYGKNSIRGAVVYDGYQALGISTFVLAGRDYSYQHRTTDFDIRGVIFSKSKEWVIQTSKNQAGCNNSTGAFRYGPLDPKASRYIVTSILPALKIRVVENKALFKKSNGKFSGGSHAFLVPGDVVAVLKENGDYSYVRFSHPATGTVKSGWVETNDLKNPFPPLSEQ